MNGISLDNQDSAAEEPKGCILFFVAQGAAPFCQSFNGTLIVNVRDMGRGLD
jgi:hypothetical protein